MRPVVSLTAQSTVQNGSVADGGVVRANAVMSVTLSATATASTVVLQASLDGTNWWNTSATISPTSAGTTSATALNVMARYVRAAITAGITGTGANVTVSVGLNG